MTEYRKTLFAGVLLAATALSGGGASAVEPWLNFDRSECMHAEQEALNNEIERTRSIRHFCDNLGPGRLFDEKHAALESACAEAKRP